MIDSTIFFVNDSNFTMRIQQAEIYLKEFENEVKRAQGATGIFRSKEDALGRIKILQEFAPGDPRVKALCRMRSMRSSQAERNAFHTSPAIRPHSHETVNCSPPEGTASARSNLSTFSLKPAMWKRCAC